MWSGFGKDIRLIKKHFRRNFSRQVKTDFVANVVGFGLITSLCLSMMLQRDIIKEGFALVSPFRYDTPESMYYGLYKTFNTESSIDGVTSMTDKEGESNPSSRSNTTRRSARFPNRDTIPVLVNCEAEREKSK